MQAPMPTAIAATPAPTATAVPVVEDDEPTTDFGAPPEQLAFVNAAAFEEASRAKRASKTAKFSS